MLKIENAEVMGWKAAIRGMRNPKNSWEKSDSLHCCEYDHPPIPGSCEYCEYNHICDKSAAETASNYLIGDNDLKLMTTLRNAGTDHRKFMRMITVYVDITAPIFWWSEFDTYKVGTVRNSCSFMHKGTSKAFGIDDFSIKNDRVYEVLRPLEKKKYQLSYPYETDEFKVYTDDSGRTYRVYRNGYVIQEEYTYVDNYGSGRTRVIKERPASIYQVDDGYFMVKLAGRGGIGIPLHKLVAKLWCPGESTEKWQVDHINCDKGNNSAENLEWVTPSENMQRALKNGLCENLSSLHKRYRLWKFHAQLFPIDRRMEFKLDYERGMTHKELAEKYAITPNQANNIRYVMKNSDVEDLFQEALVWDRTIEHLNTLRDLYLETRDEKIFQAIRCLLPSGYLQRSTVMLNYEVLANIYKSRRNHRLDEWHTFCDWIERLPYSELITGGKNE